jgi:flagellar biosynthesis/type III secretory pathway protein FliH
VTLTRGRVVKGGAGSFVPVAAGAPRTLDVPRGRIARREIVEADERAQQIVAAARRQAEAIVSAAERESASVRLSAEALGRADAAASIAAKALALAAHEASAAERELDRAVALARLLAERLLGEALALAPDRVTALARQALTEASGARRVTIAAHPADAEILERSLGELGVDGSVVAVVVEPARPRGNLRIQTEIGVLDGDIAPQLERLSRKLRESMSR